LGAKSVTKWLQELMIFWLDFWTASGAQKEGKTILGPSHPGPRGGDKGEGKPSPLGLKGLFPNFQNLNSKPHVAQMAGGISTA
jgi:hypothetical protein